MFIEEKHLYIVKNILKKYPYIFYVFGSRSRGTQKTLSDLDIGFFDTIPLKDRIKIEMELEESDLPYTVDIVDLNKCSKSFFKSIEKDLQQIE